MQTYILGDREEPEQCLIDDYFGDDETPLKYSEENFRRMYRMSSILFAKIVNDITNYDVEPLPKPTLEDIEKTYAMHEEKHGLPRMLGSIDCMHWDWKNYPKALHGQFKRRNHKYPTLMLEAVADQKLWIWYAFFGVPGVNNDLNVLYGSPLFDDVLADTALEAPFVVNGRTYKKGYYLADGIYPTWSTFVKTYFIARDEKTLKFKKSLRKFKKRY
ncbi:RNA-directed DNA polymerase, eukaryota [Tanacetum coccineum]